MPKPTLLLDTSDFELREVYPGVLKGTLFLNGVPLHVELAQVTDIEGVQTGATTHADLFFSELPNGDGPYQTVGLNGKNYTVHIYPYTR